ncbi:DUF418 domain-containing protein [Niveispirillum sp. SYP-B3756]|uniref:DUF418 domain-containing protein n=1 Tax=Niveispirillum sp. SYP-B3756 TaxID=2662178 RepID=UPI001290C759|nr:DUF418 domain-containing protein [Niveispirillum sp. SYP-B3756]MQP65290.1 DUF418 domain-containing protein [Niveispirillum sp. SYP-B3756]
MTGSAKAGRIQTVDALRGFALFGILLVNIEVFANPFYAMGLPNPDFAGPVAQGTSWLVTALFETKFYLIFSFLFGYSLTLQMTVAERDGQPFRPRFLRRQAMLFCLGVFHALVLFHGDILTTYAVLGLALYALRHRNDKSLLRIAAGLIFFVTLIWFLILLAQIYLLPQVPEAMVLQHVRQAQAAFTGSVSSLLNQRLSELSNLWIVLGFMQGPCALAMFLLGLMAGRRQALADIAALQPLLRRIILIGVLVGLPGGIFYGWTAIQPYDPVLNLVGVVVDLATAPFLAAAYIAGMALVLNAAADRGWVAMLATAGRMALSNYLFQSLLCALLFHAYGLRLMGQVSPPLVVVLAMGIFALQLVLSQLWLSRFRNGPVEYLLRYVTYGGSRS